MGSKTDRAHQLVIMGRHPLSVDKYHYQPIDFVEYELILWYEGIRVGKSY